MTGPAHAELERMLNEGLFEPYIRYIRFPHFRSLRAHTKVSFDHPITALVGPNGTNKTAVLRALQGAPANYNVGQFWFSTNLDPISPEDRHRFIYGYLAQSVEQIVEVAKSRIARKPKRSKTSPTSIRRHDPDYFEPIRPRIEDGMEKPPPIDPDAENPERSVTRWNTITKDVVYLDFRSELSAYDKFFYHTPHIRATNLAKKKALIRRRSMHIRKAISTQVASYTHNRKERIVQAAKPLPSEQVASISLILGRKYESITVLEHTFFDVTGSTVVLHSAGSTYSEAYAGSGEFAVVMLVKAINDAPSRSLVLLDEPEVSLHPGAQRQLMNFISEQAKRNKHQFVVSTHSPEIVRDLPPQAIKVFFRNETDGKIDLISQSTEPTDAFFRLGVKSAEKWVVYVEDKLALEIVRKAARPLGEEPNNRLDVQVLPGGASSIKGRFVPSLALTQRKRCLVLLDGDQRPADDCPIPDDVTDGALGDAVESALGQKLSLPLDSSKTDSQRQELLRTILSWIHNRVDYLPGRNPESLLLAMEGNPEVDGDCKALWVERATRALDLPDWERPASADILAEQNRALAKISNDHPLLTTIRERLVQFLHGEQ